MRRYLLLATVCFASCGASLPAGWESAEPFPVTQSECRGTVDGASANARVETSVEAGKASVKYLEAAFRCDQVVEAFAKRSGGRLDLLFQPEDLDPSSVARCSCKYDFESEFTLQETTTLSVWRRSDSVGGEKLPEQVVEVTLPLN